MNWYSAMLTTKRNGDTISVKTGSPNLNFTLLFCLPPDIKSLLKMRACSAHISVIDKLSYVVGS